MLSQKFIGSFRGCFFNYLCCKILHHVFQCSDVVVLVCGVHTVIDGDIYCVFYQEINLCEMHAL